MLDMVFRERLVYLQKGGLLRLLASIEEQYVEKENQSI